ncbi:MAG: hypothetical protein KDC24_12860 [Saprospiraceae bacterium]|nr:hypothetical protein [Saprospiraceae bacterium]
MKKKCLKVQVHVCAYVLLWHTIASSVHGDQPGRNQRWQAVFVVCMPVDATSV